MLEEIESGKPMPGLQEQPGVAPAARADVEDAQPPGGGQAVQEQLGRSRQLGLAGPHVPAAQVTRFKRFSQDRKIFLPAHDSVSTFRHSYSGAPLGNTVITVACRPRFSATLQAASQLAAAELPMRSPVRA